MPQTRRDQDGQKSRVRTFSWGDPAISVQAARSLSGIDFVRKIMRGQIPAPPVLGLIDFRLVKVEPGAVSGELEPAEFHYNPMAECTAASSAPCSTRSWALRSTLNYRPVACSRPSR